MVTLQELEDALDDMEDEVVAQRIRTLAGAVMNELQKDSVVGKYAMSLIIAKLNGQDGFKKITPKAQFYLH